MVVNNQSLLTALHPSGIPLEINVFAPHLHAHSPTIQDQLG